MPFLRHPWAHNNTSPEQREQFQLPALFEWVLPGSRQASSFCCQWELVTACLLAALFSAAGIGKSRPASASDHLTRVTAMKRRWI